MRTRLESKIMKPLTCLTIAVCLVGALAPAALAQDAPATQPATGTTGTTQPATAPAGPQLTPEEQRTRMIDAIMSEMNLPEQTDTGVQSPHFFVPQKASEAA